MKQSERLEIIIDTLQREGKVKVSDLSLKLGCSEVTIRNDIRKLDDQGVLKKTYGGAVQKQDGLSVSFMPGEFFLNGEEKQRIALKAYEYIDNRDSIIIDDSTTGCYLAKIINEHPEKNLIVVTNSLFVAAELYRQNMQIYLLPVDILLAHHLLLWIILRFPHSRISTSIKHSLELMESI